MDKSFCANIEHCSRLEQHSLTVYSYFVLRLFSEGVIGDEEIIDDSQVITEDVGDVHHMLAAGQMHDDQVNEFFQAIKSRMLTCI